MIKPNDLARLREIAITQKRLDRWGDRYLPPIDVLMLLAHLDTVTDEALKLAEQVDGLREELRQWKDGIEVDKCNRCGAPPPLMIFQYHDHAGSDTGFAFCKKCYAPVVRGDYDEQKKKKKAADESDLAAMEKDNAKAKFMNDFRDATKTVMEVENAIYEKCAKIAEDNISSEGPVPTGTPLAVQVRTCEEIAGWIRKEKHP